ncbi:hypothetical protein EGW08_016131 [Elysia chlorotica]|uniref:Uncharacterized protein n=1 Tax=Elysia chlorotica TaxID=188477 RepID=A0A433T3L4_ELYCH|nr:hypothetical protein EGW08_016131 [Elysia chlorotica]
MRLWGRDGASRCRAEEGGEGGRRGNRERERWRGREEEGGWNRERECSAPSTVELPLPQPNRLCGFRRTLIAFRLADRLMTSPAADHRQRIKPRGKINTPRKVTYIQQLTVRLGGIAFGGQPASLAAFSSDPRELLLIPINSVLNGNGNGNGNIDDWNNWPRCRPRFPAAIVLQLSSLGLAAITVQLWLVRRDPHSQILCDKISNCAALDTDRLVFPDLGISPHLARPGP